MKGTVTKSTGSWYTVLAENGHICFARTRGKMRLENLDTSNPVAVGDEVMLERDSNYENTASIVEVLPRKNWVIRKANKLSSKRQILASNLDAAVLVGSIISPRTSLGFIDRFLVGCQAFHVPAILFLNKSDLLGSQLSEVKIEIERIYENAQVGIYFGSAFSPESINPFKTITQNKRILLAGHSGVGKSTLMNALYPGFNAKVGAISKSHEKGKHTTTFAEMYTTPDGTQIIDTPGIRDFGVVDIPTNELPQYFPEFREFMSKCKFNNCTHVHEPECYVLYQLQKGNIPQERYYSYRSIMNNEDIFK